MSATGIFFEIGEEMRHDIEKLPEVEKFYVDPGSSKKSKLGGGSKMEVNIFWRKF